jgi:hypothetical protein
MRTLGGAGDVEGALALGKLGEYKTKLNEPPDPKKLETASLFAQRILAAPPELQGLLYNETARYFGVQNPPQWGTPESMQAVQTYAALGQPQKLSLTETGEGYSYLPEEINAGEVPPKPVKLNVSSPKSLAVQEQAKKEAAEAKKTDFKNANDLRDEYNTQSKTFVDVRDSYGRVLESATSPSPAGDLALIFNYMKMLDPGSVVRESEFANAAATGAYGERIKAAVGKIATGERLSDAMRQDFLSRSEMLFKRTKRNQDQLKSEYTRLSRGFDVDPSSVIVDYSLQGTQPVEQGISQPTQTGIKFLGFE